MEGNMETGRTLFTNFLKGESLSRPAFVPLLWGLLERVTGIPLATQRIQTGNKITVDGYPGIVIMN